MQFNIQPQIITVVSFSLILFFIGINIMSVIVQAGFPDTYHYDFNG